MFRGDDRRGRQQEGKGAAEVQEMTDWGGAMGISKEVRTKIPHDWEVQSWGNLMYSSEEQTDAILPSFGRL